MRKFWLCHWKSLNPGQPIFKDVKKWVYLCQCMCLYPFGYTRKQKLELRKLSNVTFPSVRSTKILTENIIIFLIYICSYLSLCSVHCRSWTGCWRMVSKDKRSCKNYEQVLVIRSVFLKIVHVKDRLGFGANILWLMIYFAYSA